MTDEEQKKAMRMLDLELRLKAIHELRWILLGHADDLQDLNIYIEGNEILNEVEKRVWQYIKGEVETL